MAALPFDQDDLTAVMVDKHGAGVLALDGDDALTVACRDCGTVATSARALTKHRAVCPALVPPAASTPVDPMGTLTLDTVDGWTTVTPPALTVACHYCSDRHEAVYDHEGHYGEGPVYAVVCGGLTDYYTTEAVDGLS